MPKTKLIKTLILLFAFITIVSAKQNNQLEIYREVYNEASVRTIMMTPDSPSLYDSLRLVGTPEAMFELARLCYSLGLYKQAKQHFSTCPQSELRDLFLIQIAQILSEESLLSHDIKDYPDYSHLLDYNSEPDTIIAFNITGYLKNFVVMPETNKDIALDSNNSDIVGKYAVQFGAFSKIELAQRLLEKLNKNGINAVIENIEGPETSLFHVRAGSFTDIEAAENYGENLNFIYSIIDREEQNE